MWRALSNTIERWKWMIKHHPCAFVVSESQRYFSRGRIPIRQLGTKYMNSRALNLSGPGTACCAGDNREPFLCCFGDLEAQLSQRTGIGADNQRVTSFLSLETWQGPKLWFVGDEMFPLLCEQRDRGLCASAQMFVRGALCIFGTSTDKPDKVRQADLLPKIQNFFKMSMVLL